jgi:hypothetical protein
MGKSSDDRPPPLPKRTTGPQRPVDPTVEISDSELFPMPPKTGAPPAPRGKPRTSRSEDVSMWKGQVVASDDFAPVVDDRPRGGRAWILLAVLALVGAGGGVFYYLKQRQPAAAPAPASGPASAKPAPAPAPAPPVVTPPAPAPTPPPAVAPVEAPAAGSAAIAPAAGSGSAATAATAATAAKPAAKPVAKKPVKKTAKAPVRKKAVKKKPVRKKRR